MTGRGNGTRSGWQLGVLAALALFAAPALAIDSSSLRLLLLSAQDNNTPQTTLRADIGVALETHTGPRSTQGIALLAPGKEARWYLQLKEPALTALVRGADRKVMVRTGGTTKTVSISEPIGELGISYEDLSRFIVEDFKLWQIADDTGDKVLAGGHPSVDSAYVYRAYTFEKDRTLPIKVQFYAKTLNNLVKLRTDTDHVQIGKKWFPGKIEIQNFPENSKATLSVRWSQAPNAPPELIASESFSATDPLPWTTPEVPASKPSP